MSKYGRERRDRERVDYQEAIISDDDEYLCKSLLTSLIYICEKPTVVCSVSHVYRCACMDMHIIIFHLNNLFLCVFLVCEDCQAIHHGDCPVHGALSPLPDIGNDMDSKQFTKVSSCHNR